MSGLFDIPNPSPADLVLKLKAQLPALKSLLPQIRRYPLCDATTVSYRHKLNRGLVAGLRRLDEAGGLSKLAEINLTHWQVTDFQRLRYFGLVEKFRQDGKRVKGMWSITPRGREFLAETVRVRGTAITFRNRLVGIEDELVDFRAAEGVADYKQVADYACDAEPAPEFKPGDLLSGEDA